MRIRTLFVARASVIAALYAALTFAVFPIAFTPVQFRLSEALTILPLFYLEAIPGLAIGCLIVNIVGGPFDMLIGTLATLAAAVLTRLLKKIYLGIWPPIVLNALLVPVIFLLAGVGEDPYLVNVGMIFISQTLVIGIFGVALYVLLKPRVKKVPVLRPITFAELRGKEKPACAPKLSIPQHKATDDTADEGGEQGEGDRRP